MKKRDALAVFAALLLLVVSVALSLTFSCQQDPGAAGTIRVTGTVQSAKDLSPVEGCTVSVGNAKTQTDSGGAYDLSVNATDGVVVTFAKYGFASTYRNIAIESDGAAFADTLLKPVDWLGNIDPGVENIITAPNGASVTIPALTGIDEELTVSLATFDVSTNEIQAVPGDFSALSSGGTETQIASAGMISVEIAGAETGASYSLAGKGPFAVVIPVTCDTSGSLPQSIAKWYFDPSTGKWIEDGTLTLSGNAYTGEVSHFSIWNADVVFSGDGCISGTIEDSAREPGDRYTIGFSFTYDGMSYNKQVSQTALSFSMIRLPVGIPIVVSVANTRTGISQVDTVTISGPGACEQAGPFIIFYPDIRGVTFFKTRDSIRFSWTYEPAGIDELVVSYWKTNVLPQVVQSFTVSPGYYEASISGLDQDVYAFRIQSAWGSDLSTGFSLTTRFADAFILTVEQERNYWEGEPEEAFDFYVYLNGSATGQLYIAPIELPLGTEVKLDAEIKPGFTSDCLEYYWFEFDGLAIDQFDQSICYVTMNDDIWVTICSCCPR